VCDVTKVTADHNNEQTQFDINILKCESDAPVASISVLIAVKRMYTYIRRPTSYKKMARKFFLSFFFFFFFFFTFTTPVANITMTVM
jgi:hypothetical protein